MCVTRMCMVSAIQYHAEISHARDHDSVFTLRSGVFDEIHRLQFLAEIQLLRDTISGTKSLSTSEKHDTEIKCLLLIFRFYSKVGFSCLNKVGFSISLCAAETR